ncbi:GntR family transcriptional regulator [Nocardia sp. NBC_01730]|uniref:GntR family transcriptional regulator n=1 Tax=Nocardia sp. NBC_01730 TaxID=2975998 RepID=UPI002E13CCD4|nr:GntR family transcriptional regulator [Nocardia sp. NBC_01730]
MSALDGLVIHRVTAAQQVADGLSGLILSGRIKPGSRLRESAIATELGVARNTVREAVRLLEMGGLVRYEVNRGAIVIAPTIEAVDALYAARAALEVAAVATKPSDAALQMLRASFDRLRAAAETHDANQIVKVDLEFHLAIVAMLNSTRIDEFYRELTRELHYYLAVLSVEDREYDRPEVIVNAHQDILSAIESGDPERAAREVETHIEQNAARVREIIRKRAGT